MSEITGIPCEICKAKDTRAFKELGGYVTYVCPRCARTWTVRKDRVDRLYLMEEEK